MTPKQSRFVEEYLVDLNATQAAIRAGYSGKTAHSQGPRLLENVEVATAIREAITKRTERVELSVDDVLRGLLKEAKAGVLEIGIPIEPSPARIRAWELLGKHLGMFIERHAHEFKDYDRMTVEEKAALLAQLQERRGISGPVH